ncbi:hypothetical protein P4S72_16160 [Vibrio sp. PP-XX7]
MNRLSNLSLTKQLIVTFILALLAIFLLMAVIIYVILIRDNVGLYHHAMWHQTKMLVSGIQYDKAKRPVSLILPTELKWIYKALPSEIKYRLVDKNGTVFLTSDQQFHPLTRQGEVFHPKHAMFDITENGYLLHVVTTRLGSDDQPYFLQVANSDRLFNLVHKGFLISVMRSTTMSILISLLLVSIAMILTLRRVLKPLYACLRTPPAFPLGIYSSGYSLRIALLNYIL